MYEPTVPGCHLMWSKGQTWETKPSTCRIWCCLQIVSELNYMRGNKPESHAELLCVVNHSVSILCCQKRRFKCLRVCKNVSFSSFTASEGCTPTFSEGTHDYYSDCSKAIVTASSPFWLESQREACSIMWLGPDTRPVAAEWALDC